MHRAGLVRLVRMGLVYLLVAAAAALGWLWHALPEESRCSRKVPSWWDFRM